MPFLAFLLPVANMFGISIFRLVMYAGIFFAVVTGALTIRQHYINIGWHKHKAAVEKQDNRAFEASQEVQRKADACAANSWFDVVTKSCQTEEAVK